AHVASAGVGAVAGEELRPKAAGAGHRRGRHSQARSGWRCRANPPPARPAWPKIRDDRPHQGLGPPLGPDLRAPGVVASLGSVNPPATGPSLNPWWAWGTTRGSAMG